MCGLIGIYDSKNSLQANKAYSALHKMLHRGPDNFGSVCLERNHLFLGHARLAIRDLTEAGRQPMFSNDGRYVITFNGEVDNYIELRNYLNSIGYRFNSNSDTEVLLCAYIEYGDKVLSHLQGCFAFAIYDTKKKTMALCRDHAGEKPLYYYHSREQLIFASELEPVIKLLTENPRLNYQSAVSYFLNGFVPVDQSLVVGVKKIKPGSIVEISLDPVELVSISTATYENSVVDTFESFSDTETLENLLEKSIRSILKNDVSVATLLSGGLDSSLITALCHKQNSNIPAFHISFPQNDKFNESLIARNVAKHIGVNLIEMPIHELPFSSLERIVSKLDEPFVDTSILPTYLVAEVVGASHKIAITGDAGDELFGGYLHYQRALLLQKLRLSPAIVLYLFKALGMLTNNREKYDKWFDNWNCIRREIPFYNMRLIEKNLFDKLFSMEDYHQAREKHFLYSKSSDPGGYINNLMNFDYNNYMVADILTKVDRASMMNSIEFRTPFLNQEVVTFAKSLPIDRKLNLKNRKIILRELASKYLPVDYDFERKMGFSIPIEDWFKSKTVFSNIYTYLFDTNGIFTHEQLKNIFDLQRDKGGVSEFIIGVWIFEKWCERLGVK